MQTIKPLSKTEIRNKIEVVDFDLGSEGLTIWYDFQNLAGMIVLSDMETAEIICEKVWVYDSNLRIEYLDMEGIPIHQDWTDFVWNYTMSKRAVKEIITDHIFKKQS